MKKCGFFIMAIFLSCSSQQNTNDTIDNPKKSDEKTITKSETIETGWKDTETYTVNVTAENENKAKQKARFQILKDIVRVRMMNQSKYTDIEKISNEFDDLFKKAEIIKRKDVAEGIEIYYQIKEPGLKAKFEKK